ncbi:hypothetical protein JOE51_001481 [Bradyrhizobium japonicum]|nr:hypothetical protein [Bradyrhizobium japonicum]
MTAEYAPPRYWEQFEELCADVFQSQFGDPTLVRYGRAGQAQQGIDILARNGVVYPIGLQCKKKSQWPVRTLTKADVSAAIDEASKFKPPLREFYILTTAPDDAALQAHVATLNQKREAESLFRVVVLGWGEIVRRATRDSDVADKHFGPTGGNTRRSPLLAVWMMSGGALEKTGRELELSVAELAQDLRDMPTGHFVIRQRESDAIVEKLKNFERPGLSPPQRQQRINLREELRILTDREARAVQGVRTMLTDPEISPWVLQAWSPNLVDVSVAAYVRNHTGGPVSGKAASNVLRLYPPKDYKRERRQSVELTKEEAASVMLAQQNHWAKYNKRMRDIVLELPNEVRARAAVPRIIQGIHEFRTLDRLPEEQIRALGAFEIGEWTFEQA